MANYQIPIAILEAHNMTSLKNYKEMLGDTIDTEKTFYQTLSKLSAYI